MSASRSVYEKQLRYEKQANCSPHSASAKWWDLIAIVFITRGLLTVLTNNSSFDLSMLILSTWKRTCEVRIQSNTMKRGKPSAAASEFAPTLPLHV